jgi:hypothetical protein
MDATQVDYFFLSELHHGDRLKEQLDSDDLDFGLDQYRGKQAIYLWLKRISPPSQAIVSTSAFADWIQASMVQVDGVAHGSIGHLGHVQFTFGRAAISQDKLDSLEALVGSMKTRRTIQRLFSELDFSIALYVGETADLSRRIREHVRGSTDFAKRLFSYGHTWEEVGLRFFLLPPETTSTQRQALERVIASMLLAPATSRAG